MACQGCMNRAARLDARFQLPEGTSHDFVVGLSANVVAVVLGLVIVWLYKRSK